MATSTAQIGKCGELLVQYELLKYGIESAPLTTDPGVDLVAYSPARSDALTIQVKTNLKAKPGGGKGRAFLDWWIPQNSPANLLALVDLDLERVWLFTKMELIAAAQQQTADRLHFFMATDPTASKRRDGKLVHDYAFEMHLMRNSVYRVFFDTKQPVEA